MIDIFTRVRARLSVPVNAILIAMNSLPATLQRFCAPAFFHNEGEPTFDLSKRGSAVLIRFRDTNFAVLTRHQLGKGAQAKEAREFTIGLDDPDGRKVGLTPVAVTQVTIEGHEQKNLEDLQICQYEDHRNGRNLRSLFLNVDLDHTLETVPPEAVQAIFTIGYPTELTNVEVGEWDGDEVPMAFRIKWVTLYLKPAPEAHDWDNDNRIILMATGNTDAVPLDPDGLSGAPVFFAWLDEARQAHLDFAGLVTNARDNRFAVYSAVHIRTALKQCVAA